MTHGVLIRSLVALGAAASIAGCQCRSDVDYVALAPPAPLDADHGQWLSMDVAPDGRLITSYYNRDRGALGFAIGETRDGDQVWWTHEKVDGYPDDQGLDPGDRGTHTSIAAVDNGDVWVAYHDVSNGTLRAALRQGGLWTNELADAGTGLEPKPGEWASLALDADNNPVIAHHDGSRGTLRISRRTGENEWASETVREGAEGIDAEGNTIPANTGMYANLVIFDGTEYITYHDAVAGTLELLEGTPGNYTHTVIDSGGVGAWPTLWTNGTEMEIAYHDVANQDLKIARRSGGGWQTATVDADEYVGADTAIFHDSEGTGIVYFDGQNNDMRVARASGDGFTTETIGGEEQALGYHNEVAFTRGRWYVASYDYTNRSLFARPL